jgi:hypothetical protein
METEKDPWHCLYEPTSSIIFYSDNYDEKENDKCIKHFFLSLKRTFAHEWNKENKYAWMSIVKIFSILDTHHLKNLIYIYQNNYLNRVHEINKYLKTIKNYREITSGYFIIALQHFLTDRVKVGGYP